MATQELKNPIKCIPNIECGEGRIRTDGPLITANAFQEHRNQPLCHFSNIVCSPRRIRTVTEQVLNLLPLPVGLQDHLPLLCYFIIVLRKTITFIEGKVRHLYLVRPCYNPYDVLLQGFKPWTHWLLKTRSFQVFDKSQPLYQLSYKSMVILINFHYFFDGWEDSNLHYPIGSPTSRRPLSQFAYNRLHNFRRSINLKTRTPIL